MRKWNFNQFFSFNNSFTQTSCLSSKMHSYPLGNVWEGNACNSIIHASKPSLKQHVKNAILTVLLLSWMTWVFAQATKTGKETLKKEPPIHIVANDSVDIAGFRVSLEEAKIIRIEEETLKELGFTKISEIYRNENRIYLFKKIASQKLRENFPGWEGYYKVYHLTLNKSGLSANKENIYKELNYRIQSKLLRSEMLSQITELKKIIDATINLSCPFQIKENLKLMDKLEE